jgi:AmmeMemoRadiSam system protein A
MAAKLLGADAVKPLKYANGGDVTGDRAQVVGYGAAVIYQSEKAKAGAPPAAAPSAKPTPAKAEPKAAAPAPSGALSAEQRKKLLSLARATIEAAVKGQPVEPAKIADPGPLQEHRGAFVTIKNHGQLRGCIGNFVAHEPLYRVVQKMAMASATQDSRFFGNQLTPPELKDIEIEISVLSPLTRIADPMQIELGKHGIYIVNERQNAAGCFLPQVATETGWSKEEFLSHCASDKAGLPPDSWKNDPDTQVLVFTAEVFGEKE